MSMQRTSGAIVRSAFLEVNARRSFVSSAKVLAKSPLPSPESSQPTPPATSFTPSPLSPSAPAIKKHNALTVGIVTSLAKLMGYNNSTTKAIRVTSDLYDRCAERAEIEADFWYNGKFYYLLIG
jgi:cytochrome b pre-mRNA-processing protein 3